jgi:hypothetical protein
VILASSDATITILSQEQGIQVPGLWVLPISPHCTFSSVSPQIHKHEAQNLGNTKWDLLLSGNHHTSRQILRPSTHILRHITHTAGCLSPKAATCAHMAVRRWGSIANHGVSPRQQSHSPFLCATHPPHIAAIIARIPSMDHGWSQGRGSVIRVR